MTAIFCKNFGKELWPKPTLTQATTCCSRTWSPDSPVRHGLSPASTPQARWGSFFERHRHPVVSYSLAKQNLSCCVSSNPTNVCSIFASKGHLSQTWFYMCFLSVLTMAYKQLSDQVLLGEEGCVRDDAHRHWHVQMWPLVNSRYYFITWILLINKHLPAPALCQNIPLLLPL